MHLMNKTKYDHLFANSNVHNKGRLLFLCVSWALGYLTALGYFTTLSLLYLGLTLPLHHFQRVVQFQMGLKTCSTVRCLKCGLHVMDPYSDHAMTCKHRPHTICRHDRMSYVQNIKANEAGFKSRLEKTSLIAGRKDYPTDVLFPMVCAGQDAYLDSVITHPLQPTFIDHAARKSLVVTKAAAAAKKHSNDNEKCRCNGLRLIAMAWETFGGSVPEMRIMIRKIAIRHADKHNRPRGQTIYQINQRLSVALQRGVGE
jgi:hypothetical protein